VSDIGKAIGELAKAALLRGAAAQLIGCGAQCGCDAFDFVGGGVTRLVGIVGGFGRYSVGHVPGLCLGALGSTAGGSGGFVFCSGRLLFRGGALGLCVFVVGHGDLL